MAYVSEDLENNPFFHALEETFCAKLREVQKKLWIICVPCSKSIRKQSITKDFVDCHVLRPSPFFKSHFLTTDASNSLSFEIEGNSIKTNSGIVKILKEEKAYNNDYKPYRILVIDQPLTSSPKQKSESFSNSSSKKALSLSLHESSSFLKSFPECTEAMNALDKKIQVFNASYIVLPQYLQDAAFKLQDMLKSTLRDFINALVYRTPKDFSQVEISFALENYIMTLVHDKIFPVVKKLCVSEDIMLNEKLLSLYDAQVTPDQLGINELFCCQPLSAVVELASLNSRSNPGEKLHCLITTLELLNQDIEQSVSKATCPVTSANKDTPFLTSDDLIPLLVYVTSQARPQYFGSNLYYVQKFCWENSPFDKLSFGLVTFQAVKEYLKNSDFEFLKPSIRKVKKEMSLKELIEVTIDMQSSSKSPVESKSSTTDYLLENVTQMIEASTRELRNNDQKSDSHHGHHCNTLETRNDQQTENVGNFLASLRQNSLGLRYGKQK